MKYQEILQDIERNNSPVGEPDEESKVFFAIDEQVMKFGSLQHDSINWDSLITHLVQYLSVICKDYKVLQYLGYALLHQNTKENLNDFLALFLAFNQKYLFKAYPKPSKDETINRFKARAILLVVNRIENVLLNNTVAFSHEQNQQAITLIKELSQQLVDYVDESAVIFNKVLRKLESQHMEVQANLTVQQDKSETSVTGAAEGGQIAYQAQVQAESLNLPNIDSFDLTNDRKLKQFYLQVADTTCELDPASILGYVSRRYGLWKSITQLPEMNAQGITAMQGIAVDKLSDYRELVVSAPSTDLLGKIEKTVVSSPYWIEGSYLAAECCRALKLDDVADAIRNVTKRFVDKHNNFSVAKFQNGDPFLPDSVNTWLMTNELNGGAMTIENTTSNFDEIYRSQGFVAVLKSIDDKLSAVTDIRSRFCLQLDKIHYFIEEGINAIALSELNELLENSKKYRIEEWDSIFFNQLNQLKDQLIRKSK